MLDLGGSMPHSQRLERIRKLFPGWEIWAVPLATGGFWWCAKRGPDDPEILRAKLASELAELLLNAQEEEGVEDLSAGTF